MKRFGPLGSAPANVRAFATDRQKQFRHTYAHRMLTVGENLAAIRAELGHKDVAVTARAYTGFLAEPEGREFGALAAERYAPNGNKTA